MIARPLVERHGAARVWRVGVATLLYPPTWITTGLEFFTLNARLAQLET